MERGIPATQNFAAGFERDEAAVAAAITLEWSSGWAKGQVSRPKLRKRQLYGRANSDLLSQDALNDL